MFPGLGLPESIQYTMFEMNNPQEGVRVLGLSTALAEAAEAARPVQPKTAAALRKPFHYIMKTLSLYNYFPGHLHRYSKK